MGNINKSEIIAHINRYATTNWKFQGDANTLTDSEHINHTIELLEEDVYNEAREEEAETLILELKALRVDGSIGKRLAVWANFAWKGCFSDRELNEYAHEYNTDADTMEEMVRLLEEEAEDYKDEHEGDEEFKTLLNDCKAHLETLRK